MVVPFIENSPYQQAQEAITDLKVAVLRVLSEQGQDGLKNNQIGRLLGIYGGHKGHQGHISRTILAMLEVEGLIRQDFSTKKWFVKKVEEMDEKHAATEED